MYVITFITLYLYLIIFYFCLNRLRFDWNLEIWSLIYVDVEKDYDLYTLAMNHQFIITLRQFMFCFIFMYLYICGLFCLWVYSWYRLNKNYMTKAKRWLNSQSKPTANHHQHFDYIHDASFVNMLNFIHECIKNNYWFYKLIVIN